MAGDKFTFFASFLETAHLMEREEAAEFVLEIAEYAIEGKEPDLANLVAQSAWPTIREVVISKQRDIENGKLGGRPRKTTIKTSDKTGVKRGVFKGDKNPGENPEYEKEDEGEEKREPLKGSLSSQEEIPGTGIKEPEPKETYTPRCPNGCVKPDGSPSDMRLDAEAEGLRCSVCGELLEVD